MLRPKEQVLLAWSGGKDSVMMLSELRKAKEYEIVALLTAVTAEDERVTLHGVSRELIEAQAASLQIPLAVTHVPKGCCRKTHFNCLSEGVAPFVKQGVRAVAFGDLFLDDMRDLREENLEALGLEALFPLWHRDTKELSYAFIREKFKAVVTCVDEASLDAGFVGRAYDKSFLADLPLAVDPCGENGEFHTFVYDGPLFKHPVPYKIGNKFSESPFHCCEVGIKPPSTPKKSLSRSS